MRVVDVNKNIIKELRRSRLSQKMKFLEKCEFLVIEEHNGKIIAASGIGGFLHIHSFIISDEFRGKGLGKKLAITTLAEMKKRGYSFLLDSINIDNIPSKKVMIELGLEQIARIHFSENKITDMGILVLNYKGRIVKKLLSFFNTKLGMIFLAIILKFTKQLYLKRLHILSEKETSPRMLYMIKHFQKLHKNQKVENN